MLNACRRQRISHQAGRREGPQSLVGAQRLSASKDLSLDGRNRYQACVECSTPVGVKGSLTAAIDATG
ncbi:hypothetical protein PLANPX_0693 [Lacipirellula parvula]|uniref:Uncharacterized protein n=1 Tax=Lacipirellula parvula TaxID=2650471 RepID=A0A5K7X8J7_9BACT|nr:hypothetical protein PLANPX_0693 [Lacipirellula parvula]